MATLEARVRSRWCSLGPKAAREGHSNPFRFAHQHVPTDAHATAVDVRRVWRYEGAMVAGQHVWLQLNAGMRLAHWDCDIASLLNCYCRQAGGMALGNRGSVGAKSRRKSVEPTLQQTQGVHA